MKFDKKHGVKTLLIVVLGLLVLGGAVGFIGAGKAFAEDRSSSSPPIVQKLVEKFGLDAEEVMEVFEAQREENQAERRAKFVERLNELVSEGKITSSQKDLILSKFDELQSKMEEWKDLEPEERKAQIENYRKELKAWADENGIDLKELFPFHLFGKP